MISYSILNEDADVPASNGDTPATPPQTTDAASVANTELRVGTGKYKFVKRKRSTAFFDKIKQKKIKKD